ncbi:MazG family protein [Micromonospora sp. M51]|nr:MazG family protein [Micromonospora sp. M51]
MDRVDAIYDDAQTKYGDAVRREAGQAGATPSPEQLRAAVTRQDVVNLLVSLDLGKRVAAAKNIQVPDEVSPQQLEQNLRLARQPGLAEMELMYGSWDPPGARLLDAVAVLDRLASPGGDPWKRAQTHRSLAGYLLEESYEAYDAISADDTDALREELGDVLLQVVLHARLAEELPEDERWSIDDVAGGLVDKMIRRNPHVFAGAEVGTLEEITENWERIKRAEKARSSVLDGVALSQPALALAAQILDRAARRGIEVPPPLPDAQPDAEARLGASLLATVAAAREAGLDPEAALRRATLAHADLIRTAEPPPADPR